MGFIRRIFGGKASTGAQSAPTATAPATARHTVPTKTNVAMGNYGFGFSATARRFRGRKSIRPNTSKYGKPVRRTKPLRFWEPPAWQAEQRRRHPGPEQQGGN